MNRHLPGGRSPREKEPPRQAQRHRATVQRGIAQASTGCVENMGQEELWSRPLWVRSQGRPPEEPGKWEALLGHQRGHREVQEPHTLSSFTHCGGRPIPRRVSVVQRVFRLTTTPKRFENHNVEDRSPCGSWCQRIASDVF